MRLEGETQRNEASTQVQLLGTLMYQLPRECNVCCGMQYCVFLAVGVTYTYNYQSAPNSACLLLSQWLTCTTGSFLTTLQYLLSDLSWLFN
jgi:hypothetical protein